jgi:hypothetical protein
MLGFVDTPMINISKEIRMVSLSLGTAAQIFYYIGLHLWHITAGILHKWSLIYVTKRIVLIMRTYSTSPSLKIWQEMALLGFSNVQIRVLSSLITVNQFLDVWWSLVPINYPCPACAPGLDKLALDQSQVSNLIPSSPSIVPSVQVNPLDLVGADQYMLASQYNDTDQEFSELETPDTYAESSSPVPPPPSSSSGPVFLPGVGLVLPIQVLLMMTLLPGRGLEMEVFPRAIFGLKHVSAICHAEMEG